MPFNANCLIALDGTFGTNGCAPVAVADACVVLSQGLFSSGVSAALRYLLQCMVTTTRKSVGFFTICVRDGAESLNLRMAGKKRGLKKKASVPCSPIAREGTSGGVATLLRTPTVLPMPRNYR